MIEPLPSLSIAENNCDSGSLLVLVLELELVLAVLTELSVLSELVLLAVDEVDSSLWIIVSNCRIWLLRSAFPVPVRAVSELLLVSDDDESSNSDTRLLDELESVVDVELLN